MKIRLPSAIFAWFTKSVLLNGVLKSRNYSNYKQIWILWLEQCVYRKFGIACGTYWNPGRIVCIFVVNTCLLLSNSHHPCKRWSCSSAEAKQVSLQATLQIWSLFNLMKNLPELIPIEIGALTELQMEAHNDIRFLVGSFCRLHHIYNI